MIDHSDEVGWPAPPTRVYLDPRRIGPCVLREERRAEQRDAARKWDANNRERKLAGQRAWRERQKQLREAPPTSALGLKALCSPACALPGPMPGVCRSGGVQHVGVPSAPSADLCPASVDEQGEGRPGAVPYCDLELEV